MKKRMSWYKDWKERSMKRKQELQEKLALFDEITNGDI